jgi:hypothetical protein
MHSNKKAKAKIEPAGCNCDIVECETIDSEMVQRTIFVRVRQQQQQQASSSGFIQNKK